VVVPELDTVCPPTEIVQLQPVECCGCSRHERDRCDEKADCTAHVTGGYELEVSVTVTWSAALTALKLVPVKVRFVVVAVESAVMAGAPPHTTTDETTGAKYEIMMPGEPCTAAVYVVPKSCCTTRL
jgi:hypothetical protein